MFTHAISFLSSHPHPHTHLRPPDPPLFVELDLDELPETRRVVVLQRHRVPEALQQRVAAQDSPLKVADVDHDGVARLTRIPGGVVLPAAGDKSHVTEVTSSVTGKVSSGDEMAWYARTLCQH